MNKFLMGTTALVAASAFTAPAFAAEKLQLSIRGYNIAGMSYSDVSNSGGYSYAEDGDVYSDYHRGNTLGDTNEINFGSSSEIHFIGSTTLDNGLEVTFHAELELEDDDAAYETYFYQASDLIDEVYIQFDGGFGRVQFGQQDGVMDQMAVTAPNTFAGHAVDDLEDRSMDPFAPYTAWAAQRTGNPISTVGDLSGDHIKIIYFTPSMNGLQLGVSYTPNPCKNAAGYAGCIWDRFGQNYWEASATWQGNYNNVSFAFSGGFGQGDSYNNYDNPQEWTVGGQIGFGGFTLGGSYKDTNAVRYTDLGENLAPAPWNQMGWWGMDPHYDETDWDVGLTYESGPWGFNLAYAHMESDSHMSCADCYTYAFGFQSDQSYHYDVEAESWIAGITYKYGPGMQIGIGVQDLQTDWRRRVSYDVYTQNRWEGFDGTSVFIENSIAF